MRHAVTILLFRGILETSLCLQQHLGYWALFDFYLTCNDFYRCVNKEITGWININEILATTSDGSHLVKFDKMSFEVVYRVFGRQINISFNNVLVQCGRTNHHINMGDVTET